MTTVHSVIVPLELETHDKLQILRIRSGVRSCDLIGLIVEEAFKDSELMEIVEIRAKELGKENH